MMDMLLNLFSIATNIAYIAFLTAGILAARKGTAAALRKACQHYWTGVALAALVVIINLASVPFDGWLSPIVNTATLGIAIVAAVLTDRQRDREVIKELQRDLGREL